MEPWKELVKELVRIWAVEDSMEKEEIKKDDETDENSRKAS